MHWVEQVYSVECLEMVWTPTATLRAVSAAIYVGSYPITAYGIIELFDIKCVCVKSIICCAHEV